MKPPPTFDEALSHCDTASVLDCLAVGVAMLDSHMCLTYANPFAMELLMIAPQEARGRPFASLFRDPSELALALHGAMERGERRSMKSLRLQSVQVPEGVDPARPFNLEISPVEGFATGTHLLLQLVASTPVPRP